MSPIKIALFSSVFGIVGSSHAETISTNPAANTDQANQHTVSSHQYGARTKVVKPQPPMQPPVVVVTPADNNLPQQRRDLRK